MRRDEQYSEYPSLPHTCNTCAYYDYGLDQCHRYPPSIMATDINKRFPAMSGDEWCGEHKLLKDEALDQRLFDIFDVTFGFGGPPPRGVTDLFPAMKSYKWGKKIDDDILDGELGEELQQEWQAKSIAETANPHTGKDKNQHNGCDDEQHN